jgi:restriction system protein
MSGVLDAVRKVLSESGQEMHYREITRLVLKKGLWRTDGKTPEATVNAQLASAIKKKGDLSGFQRVGNGVFVLANGAANSSDPVQTKGMKSFTESAEEVLEKYANHQPMHYKEITRIALEKGFLVTSGQTPEATMYAQIIQEEQRRNRRGQLPRFERFGKGMVGLARWRPLGMEREIEKHNRQIRDKLLQRIRRLSPTGFEDLIGQLLTKMGFSKVEVTKASGDGGVDVRGTLVVGEAVCINMAVQAKKWSNNIQAPEVQKVRGSLSANEKGLIITTSAFSKGAYSEAVDPKKVPIDLMSGEQLVALLVEHNLLVGKKNLELLVLSDDDMETAQ